jgi:cytochrome c oxidase cbb3-type subunit 3
MSKSPLLLLATVSLLCLSAAVSCVDLKPVLAAAQEPDQQPRTTGTPAPARNSHDFLGLGPAPDLPAAKRGDPLFKENCAACHGATARGAQGPNLIRSVLVLHDEKGEEIGQVIKNGRPQGGMPAFANLTDAQIYDISAYIHLQVELAANRSLYTHSNTLTSGDPAKGKDFFTANCASCHSASGDLAKIGAKYPQPPAMLVRFAWPASRGPRQATVTTPSGEKLTGTLTHYDDFETTLKSATGASTTWPTTTVKVEIPDKLAGHRDLLPRYSDDDLHNLTQYLVTLK